MMSTKNKINIRDVFDVIKSTYDVITSIFFFRRYRYEKAQLLYIL